MIALREILEGKDAGRGICNPPWEGVRRSVIRLVGDARATGSLLALALDPKQRQGVSLQEGVRALVHERDALRARLEDTKVRITEMRELWVAWQAIDKALKGGSK
jgi:hypothetical protein